MDIYLQLPNGSQPPNTPFKDVFKAVVIIEQDVSNDWRNQISDWLVESGCKYMMAWGRDCSLWDDAVDWTCVINEVDGGIHNLVMTTWHERDSLEEVFYFAQHHAIHPDWNLETLVVIHISETDKTQEFEALHKVAAIE